MIRPYESRDLDTLLEVWFQASQIAHPFLSAEFLAQERIDIRTQWLPLAKTWVYETSVEVGGFISMVGNEIGALFVHPRLHRRGIGRRLVDHVRPEHDVLEVQVFKANALGRAFYEAYGFEPVSESVHAETGQALVRMKR